MKPLIYLFILPMIGFDCSCESDLCKSILSYDFDIPVTLTPEKDSFQIGDTIYISSVFSKDVYERNTEKTYLLEGYRFDPSLIVYKIDSIDDSAGLQNFNVLIDTIYNFDILNSSSGTIGLAGEYLEKNNQYSLEFKLVPQKAGQYFLTHGSGVNGAITQQSFPGKCKNVFIEIYTTMNEGADNNIKILEESPVERYNTWLLEKPDERFYKYGGYAFWVVE